MTGWDPTAQECLGHFGYGTGYFIVEEAIDDAGTFCLQCPRREECWAGHRQRMRELHPEEALEHERHVAAIRAAGGTPSVMAAVRLAAGLPDPWIRGMEDNIRLGAEARAAA